MPSSPAEAAVQAAAAAAAAAVRSSTAAAAAAGTFASTSVTQLPGSTLQGSLPSVERDCLDISLQQQQHQVKFDQQTWRIIADLRKAWLLKTLPQQLSMMLQTSWQCKLQHYVAA
jgi:hypothetical protein